MRLAPVACEDVAALAPLHAAAFAAPWPAAELEALARSPGVATLAAWEGPAPLGFVMVRSVLGEAEVLTLAVDPAARRRGIGRALVEAAAEGVDALFLEVAEDNAAARALYAAAGLREAGRRRGYYARGAAPAVDALVLRRGA